MKRYDSLSLVLTLATALVARAAEPASTPGPQIVAKSSQRLESALEQTRRETDVDQRLQHLWELGSSLSSSEFPGALEAGSRLKELRERMVFQEAALVRWGELAPQDAFAHIAALPESQLKVNILRGVAKNFVRVDPPRAAAAAALMNPGAARNDAIETIAHIWAQSDVSGALQWAEQLPNDFAKDAALTAIRYIWVRSDPVAAAKHVEKLPAGQNKTNLIGNAAHAWAVRDPQAAIQWVRDLPDGNDKNEALVQVAESWANQDPNQAAAFALGLPPGETRLAAAAMVASRWAKQDPRAAVEWSWRHEDSEVRKRGVVAALEVWTPVDPVAAGQWVGDLQPGPQRDQILLAYVEFATMWSPDLAADRALLIADAKVRTRALDQCLSRWREVDLAAAERWMREADQTSAQPASGQVDDGGWQDLMVSAVQAQRSGDAAEAKRLATKALEVARSAEPADVRVARSQMLLGEIYRWQKNYAAAEESLQAAVASCEKVVGPEHPQMITPLDSLANFYYYHNGQYEKVLPLYQRLLQLVEQDSSRNQRDIAQRARNLGNVYRYLDKPGEAESYYKTAIAQVEQISASSPDLPQHLLTLAEFYRYQQRYAEAEPLAKRALAIHVEGSGADSLDATVSLDGLADVYLAWGKPAEAEPLYARALAIAEAIAGPEHADLAPRLVGLAESQRDQGKHLEAEANYRRAIAVVEQGLGRDAPELIPFLKSYAQLLEKTNRTMDASETLARAEAIGDHSGGE